MTRNTGDTTRLNMMQACRRLGIGYRRFQRLLNGGEIPYYYEREGSTSARRLYVFDVQVIENLAQRLKQGRKITV